ncbi:hydrocephalus-inducing protein homolog isoform 2-T2 [Spinachia spinachia]
MTANPFPSRTKWVKSKVPFNPQTMTPSAYSQEMLQSTEERLANTDDMQQPRIVELLDMSETTRHKSSIVDMDQPLFQLHPPELVFQNFTPAQTYMLRLVLRNIDTVSRHVMLELQESEYFHVVGPEDAGSRVAPGLSASFTVFFTPQENKDYHHRLVFVTERERFQVPVRAIGPRAILDFRDELHFSVCPVKASTETTQHVRNTGNGKAKFKLDTQSPFSVTPSSGTVDVGGSVQVTVDFHPMTVGVHNQSLVLHYHTGEDVHISLQGVCEELDIRLEADSVRLKKTYMSLASHRTVSLTYRSEIPLKYCWTTWPSLKEEALSLLRESSELPQVERKRLLAQCEADPTVIHRLPLLSTALQERRSQTVKDHRLVLSHSCITVEPADGEIWPRTPARFDIVFKPEEAKLYQQTIYCDITGREARLPLTIMAEGIGPNVQFNYDLMDMQNVVIGDKDYYEVQVRNRGLIDAPFRLSSRDTTFGRCFSFCPEKGVLRSGACQNVEVTFCGQTLGTFTEDLLLTVTGGTQPLTVTFSGCVIAPTCHFNLAELTFGDVGFGFPRTLMCTLFNTSFVPMTFALRVLGDGSRSPSITCARQESKGSFKDWGGTGAGDLHASRVEFTVTPAAGCVRAMSDVPIKVTLCSNTVKTYRVALVVDVEGVGKEIVTLPIKARCVVPDIVVENPVLNFQRCFLDHRYEQKVRLTNTGPLPACYGVLDQEYEECPSLLFGSSTPTGMIDPHSSEELPVFLLAKAVGRQQHTLRIAVFGSVQPPQEVILSCIGQGPIVHVHSQQLDFGAIPVLMDITKSLHLSNQSPIPAYFTACMFPQSHGGTFGRVEPSEGEVPPESQLELSVVAHLKDTLHFQARMEVSIRNSHVHTVILSATGTGTTIVSDRPLAPTLDLGTYLSHASCQYPFKLTNQGNRTHRLYWRTDCCLCTKTPKGSRTVLPPIRTSSKKKGFIGESLPSSGEERQVFSLRPSRVELAPGGSVDMVLTGSSDSPKVVQERLVCHGIVGRRGCKELIMCVDLTCRFVAPMLSISSGQLKFHKEKVPGESLMPLYEKLVLENVSSLSLSVELSLVEPFSLCEASGAHSPATTKSMVIGDGRQAELWVCFDPTCCQDRVSRVVEEVLEIHYQGHPEQHKVELYAEVHFPNLHFSDTTVDFGCVLNLTGARRAISITNCSPLPVSFHWVFLGDREHGAIRETEIVEVEGEQTNPENGTREEEEGWSSSKRPSLAFSDPLGLGPGADERNSSQGPVGVQEVFDILPIFGHLQPGEQQQVIFCFYGHENVSREVIAQCLVEEGPTYDIQLRGEASLISYSLDSTHIDFGLLLFDHEGEAEVTLTNTGKIGFNFSIIHPPKKGEEAEEEAGGPREALGDEQKGERHDVIPGQPMVIPATGYIDAGAEQCLRVLFLPGAPEVFERQIQLQVAFLLPQVLTLTGEGVFPRISLNLPQNLHESYSDLVLQARTAVEGMELMNGTASDERQTTETNSPPTYKELLHMEIERLMVKRNALAVTDSLLEFRQSHGSFRKWHKLSQFLLPEYVLDFGYVIPAIPRSHSVNVTNTGSVAVSFNANVKPLTGTGFSTDFKRVKNLPCGETQTFTVKFDPQTADLKMGDTSVVMPIQVVGGPTVQLRLCALVTEPAVTVSTDTLHFDTVQCGMCQMRTIQLFNPESVPCFWSIVEKGKPIKKRQKDLQMQQPPAVVFKMIPSSGTLSPGERVNVQIKFTPAEGSSYKRQLDVRVADSSQQLFITARGRAEEPHLEFCPPVVELGPCLPLTTDVEVNVIVRNPCPFPVEFYCLELDTEYLEEEKILRLVKGYDENRILLLPPRAPGESLPQELLDYYQEHHSQLKDDVLQPGLNEEEAVTADTYEEGDSKVEEMHALSLKPAELLVSEMTVVGNSEELGQLEINPVSRAIARHMCVDLSPEGLAARNRRGIAIIVYGAPLTDNGSCVAALARHYGGACLSVDAVVTEVLVNGTSPISQTARQLYDCAAAGSAGKKPEEAAQFTEYEPETHAEASEPTPHSAPAPRGTLEAPLKPIEDGFSGNGSKAVRGTENTHFTVCLGGDVDALSNLLPEQLLVDILAERFQLSDCHRGIVIAGLKSAYAQSAANLLQIILKALDNRKRIFVVNLSDSYGALKAREQAQREAQEALEKEKAEREEPWLQELDDEYDALPEKKKEHIDQRQTEKELEHLVIEQEEKRLQEEKTRLKEEELKKNKKGGKKDPKDLSADKSALERKQTTAAVDVVPTSSSNNSKKLRGDEREQLPLNEAHQSKGADHSQKKTEEAKRLPAESSAPADKLEGEKPIQSIVDELQSQFSVYEQTQEQVDHILQHWDRARGLLLVPLPGDEAPAVPEDAPTEKQTAVGKKSKKHGNKISSPMPSQMSVPAPADVVLPQDIIPHIVLNVTGRDSLSAAELLKGCTLPPLAEVLDDLGLGPSGPPVPPPTTFSVVPIPENRGQSNIPLTCSCFTFLVPFGLDEQDEEKKDWVEDMHASVVKEGAGFEGRIKATLTKIKDKKSRESQKSKRQTSDKTKAKGFYRSGSPRLPTSSTPDCAEQDHHKENLELKRSQGLTTFRWVVPANGEVVLRIWFYSEFPITFEQTFNFELLGTRRRHQLLCRGIGTYPSISKDYMTLFAYSKKVPQMEEGLHNTYVINPGYFEFGPLLCDKTRDGYKERRHPDNTQRLVIHNVSGLEAEVRFHFQHDSQATTYLLDPPTMTLKPDQKQELTVWAYPTKLGQMKDSVVCYVKDNPELVIVHLSCRGVRPELELETNHCHFKRTLLNRRESSRVTLHNKTALPVSWRLLGVEDLGDEFSVPQDQGIVRPMSSYPLSLHFRSKRPLHIKKILYLEVAGVEKKEKIQVTAEAYAIDLEITPNGCVNFGTIKVFEEVKLSLRMKNPGKYEIAYKFTLQRTDPSQPNLDAVFTVSPHSGTLMPHEKPTAVQLLCRPSREVLIKEQPVLHCQVIEPSIGNGGELIATIAIEVSVKSVFSRYKITPACDLNFGPLVYGLKKSQSFTIQNDGDFETRFIISRMISNPAPSGKAGGPVRKMPPENHSERSAGASSKVRRESNLKDMGMTQNRLTMGVFSVSPCSGSLQPGSQQVVTVDCVAEQLGDWNQCLLIDVSERDPSDWPDGIPYRLMAEVCKPSIALDMPTIFEEHHLCHNGSQLSSEQFCNAERIYIQDENTFMFNTVLVGKTAQARFKITNNSKVPCVLSLSIKYVGSKTSRSADVFNLSAATLSIPSQSHLFAVVTFTPQTMLCYNAVFEATMEATSRMTPTFKSKVLEFNLKGEGSLPSVCVVRPALRNSTGCPTLQFRPVLVGRSKTRPLVLLNDGNVPAQVQIDMLDKHGVFALKAATDNSSSSIHSTRIEASNDSGHQLVHRVMLSLNVDQQVEFQVSFCSDKPLSVKAKMSLQVEDNQYGNTILHVTGEAYQEIVSLDNIRRSLQEIDQENGEGGYYEVLSFGDCHVNCSYQENFTMTNHSSSQVVRFEWPPLGSHVSFSPQAGHLHAGCSKEVTVTFASNQPVTLTSQPIRCKLSQVQFQQPLEQVADWDDRRRTVQWRRSPKQKKVMKTDPEPCCSVVEGSQWELELQISAVCDYVKFSCSNDTIHFKDTMLYQTRLHQLQIVNHGTIRLEYSWQVLMAPSNNVVNQDQGDGTLPFQPGGKSGGVFTEARSASVMSPRTVNPKLLPISIEPSIGAVAPGSTQTISIHFSPLEVAQFHGRLVSRIPNLQDGDEAPCVSVSGRSLLPHCHFQMDDSDYISGNRRNPDFRGALDPNTRVIEFSSVGLSVPSKRCFSVVNPTNKPYAFKWRCGDTGGSPFCCLTPRGTILPGKRAEVCFEYVAEQYEAVESTWSFTIESLSLSVPFLCVGTTKEPLVYLDRPHLDFGELLVGRTVEQTVDLVNGEEEPFHFSVRQSSLLTDDQQSRLILHPMTGTVAPRDRSPLSVSFTPCRDGHTSFRLILRVKRKSEPIVLTVRADCFCMSTSVHVENPEGGLREISPNLKDTLDFGKVGILEQSAFHFLVSNEARFRLEVNFDLTGPVELQQFQIKPQIDTIIEVGDQLRSSLFFCPRRACDLRDVRLSIRVKHGPTFTFTIEGSAVAPSLEFSFTKHNFGKCLVYGPGMVPASRTLVISNKGDRDIRVECQFRNTSYLEMELQPDIVSPGAVVEAPIHFCPREAGHYRDRIPFVLNSCVTTHVDILGQGVEVKLEVENPKQRKVKLGSLKSGQKMKKQVVLVNRGPLDLSFILRLNTNTPLNPRVLSFSPAGELNLKAGGGSCNVEIQFSPRQHIPPFTAELQAEIAGWLHPVLSIHGCCQGVEVQLDQNHLAFEAVVQRCQATKRIIMRNAGDLGARFQWQTEIFPPEVSITPTKGYICPGIEVPFEVTFSPVELINDIRYEKLSCCVEGSSSPVTLTVTGSCIVASTSKEVGTFVCPVRGSHSQTLHVSNPTNQHCCVTPVIEGEQWSAASSVILEPLQNKTYEITYRPLSVTADGKKHLGSVFFSFPDGTGTLYSLQGTAEPPKAEGTIVHELPAKTHHTEMLPVHNWLSKKQRFHVSMEILKPDKHDATVSLKGLGSIDVPASASLNYNMSFFSFREGHYNTKVTFVNEVSGDYLFYLITFKATPPGVLSTIELLTAVRQTASATVQVENPLTTVTYLTTECKCPEISAPPQHTVPGRSKGSLNFEYQPLHPGESTARLTLHSSDLGYFHYDLFLRAVPPPPEKTVHFSTFLGSSHSVLVKFTSHARLRAEYSGKTDCPDFVVDKAMSQVGSEVSVEVHFEPHQVGEVRGLLSMSSAIGGEYIFPLRGMGLPPRAQGPFSIRAGRNIAIPFKNIFLQTTAFSFQVNNPCFTVKDVEAILPKKTQNILTSFEAPPGGSPGPWFGTLTISTQPPEGHSKPYSWIYYLRGYRAEST